MLRQRSTRLGGIALIAGMTLLASACANTTTGSTTPAGTSDTASASSTDSVEAQGRVAISYPGGISVLDSKTLEVVKKFDSEEFTRLNAAGTVATFLSPPRQASSCWIRWNPRSPICGLTQRLPATWSGTPATPSCSTTGRVPPPSSRPASSPGLRVLCLLHRRTRLTPHTMECRLFWRTGSFSPPVGDKTSRSGAMALRIPRRPLGQSGRKQRMPGHPWRGNCRRRGSDLWLRGWRPPLPPR